MKFLVGQIPGGTAVFLVSGDTAINLTEQDSSLGPDLLGVITSGKTVGELQEISKRGKMVLVASLKPALPVTSPGMTICLGLNYVNHVKEGGYEIPKYPVFFMRAQRSLMPETCSSTVFYWFGIPFPSGHCLD